MASTSNLIQVTANGLVFPTFSQIRSTIIDMYKSAYGTDIDLSTGSADGVFVNNLALIMKNIIDTNKLLYANLDIRTASGQYLDALCALSNVFRKGATNSLASITVTNIGTNSITLDNTIFVDQAGNEWQYEGSVTIASGAAVSILVTCVDPGPIEAPAGWINQTLEVLNVTVSQPSAANVGLDVESDDQLRERRFEASSPNGLTTLQALVGALLSLSGIDDVEIYNNPTGSSISAKDTTSVSAHSIYAILRYHAGVSVSNSTIGKIIYNKLTPGIRTIQSAVTDARKSYTVQGEMIGIQLTDANQTIRWKQAQEFNPLVKIQIWPNDKFTNPNNTPGSPSEYEIICPALMNYFNRLPIGTDLNSNNIVQQLIKSDPKYYGKRTFDIGLISYAVNEHSPSYSTVPITNPDDYYNYDTYEIDTTSPNQVFIIFSNGGVAT